MWSLRLQVLDLLVLGSSDTFLSLIKILWYKLGYPYVQLTFGTLL